MTAKRSIPNQPSRGRGDAENIPAPAQIREAREAAGLTQTQSAHLVYSTLVSWQRWEAGDRRMHPALWELYLLRTDQHATHRLMTRES